MSTIFALAVIVLSVTSIIGFNERFSHAQETIDVTNPTLPTPVINHTPHDILEHIEFVPSSVLNNVIASDASHTPGHILYGDGSALCDLKISSAPSTVFLLFGETITVKHNDNCADDNDLSEYNSIFLSSGKDEVFHQGDVLVIGGYIHKEVYREQTLYE